jgi:hypothetical protein
VGGKLLFSAGAAGGRLSRRLKGKGEHKERRYKKKLLNKASKKHPRLTQFLSAVKDEARVFLLQGSNHNNNSITFSFCGVHLVQDDISADTRQLVITVMRSGHVISGL